MFDKVNGDDEMRKALEAGEDVTPLLDSWRKNSEQFREERKKWLLY